jgi:hypothetical protein
MEGEMGKTVSEQKSATGVSDRTIDDAVEASFPASDPPAPGGVSRIDEPPSDSDREARIRRRAYELWEEAGCPDDHTDEYWYRAEAEISEAGPSGPTEPGPM